MTDNRDKTIRNTKDFLLSEKGRQAVQKLEQSIKENPEEWKAFVTNSQQEAQEYFTCSHEWRKTSDKYTDKCVRCGWSRFDADLYLEDHPEMVSDYSDRSK